jgi:ligand-binding SRPBCC domain-containing protein
MAEHILTRKLTLDLPRQTVFDFFADAGNLERITPPELNFHITTKQPIVIKKGALINYQLKLRGFPVKWQTIISEWNPPNLFVDEALKSPYRQWIHRHTFTELSKNKTFIEDEVKYRLPLAPFGDLAHWFVRRELDYIFDFRQKIVSEILRQKAKEILSTDTHR